MGENNPNWGAASVTDNTRKLLSKASLGRKHTPESIQKLSAGRKGKGCGNRNAMRREECVCKWITSNNIKPNKKELQLKEILDSLFPNVYSINTRGEVLIIDGCIPDFISRDRKIIELYGDYWHKGEDENIRINRFSVFGYKTIIIWEKELKNLELLKNKLVTFNETDYSTLTI